jgi:soluble lytic murein transglycosylase-like protein
MFKYLCVLPFVASGFASSRALAQAASPDALPAQFRESAPCVSDAAQYHGVNPWVLRAILKVESNFNPRAVNRNANGSMDVGMAQINSIHFAELGRWGVLPANLMDGCVATYVAAWHLARQIGKYGNSWFGVASYHSTSPCQNARYAGLVWNALVGWRVVTGPQVKVASLQSCASAATAMAIPKSRRQVAGTGAAPALAFDEGP